MAVLVALALAPWAHPLSFQPLPGWHSGTSGNTYSFYGGPGVRTGRPPESAAWIARNVLYRDSATADPPNKTLAHLSSNGVIVWAVIFAPTQNNQKPIKLDLVRAAHLRCCDGPVTVTGGEYDLDGYGTGRAYSVIVRVYFGSPPTRALVTEAQRALNQLRLPAPR
jgi:hypothetical protein